MLRDIQSTSISSYKLSLGGTVQVRILAWLTRKLTQCNGSYIITMNLTRLFFFKKPKSLSLVASSMRVLSLQPRLWAAPRVTYSVITSTLFENTFGCSGRKKRKDQPTSSLVGLHWCYLSNCSWNEQFLRHQRCQMCDEDRCYLTLLE